MTSVETLYLFLHEMARSMPRECPVEAARLPLVRLVKGLRLDSTVPLIAIVLLRRVMAAPASLTHSAHTPLYLGAALLTTAAKFQSDDGATMHEAAVAMRWDPRSAESPFSPTPKRLAAAERRLLEILQWRITVFAPEYVAMEEEMWPVLQEARRRAQEIVAERKQRPRPSLLPKQAVENTPSCSAIDALPSHDECMDMCVSGVGAA
jgi:hypothetical protein